MFSSFSSFSNPIGVPRFLGGDSEPVIDIQAVDIHDVETSHEKRARTLKHLLKLNHAKHAIVYHHLQFDNHMPHILGSAYILGANPEHLDDIFERESRELEKWRDSPGEISDFDWRDYLGDKRYQRAYVDFFEDQLVLHGYDWKRVLNKYLFEGKEPLINCLISGVGHPLIHLAYAYELSSREIAMEALGLTAISYDFLHKYIDDPSYSKQTPSYESSDPIVILQKVAEDKRFDGLFHYRGPDNIETLFKDREAAVLDHWNAWQLPNPKEQFEKSQYAAAALLAGTRARKYDFFLVHVLTTSHAVRILLPLLPSKYHLTIVKQWWLMTLAVYIAQVRPKIDLSSIEQYDLKGKDWAWVDKQAVEGKWSLDSHYVKASRAMKEAATTWGDDEQYFLKAAVKFAEEFSGWGGFGPL